MLAKIDQMSDRNALSPEAISGTLLTSVARPRCLLVHLDAFPGRGRKICRLGKCGPNRPERAKWSVFDQFWLNEPEWAGSREENGPNRPNGSERAKWSVFDHFWPNGPEWAGSREENGPNGPNGPERDRLEIDYR